MHLFMITCPSCCLPIVFGLNLLHLQCPFLHSRSYSFFILRNNMIRLIVLEMCLLIMTWTPFLQMLTYSSSAFLCVRLHSYSSINNVDGWFCCSIQMVCSVTFESPNILSFFLHACHSCYVFSLKLFLSLGYSIFFCNGFFAPSLGYSPLNELSFPPQFCHHSIFFWRMFWC